MAELKQKKNGNYLDGLEILYKIEKEKKNWLVQVADVANCVHDVIDHEKLMGDSAPVKASRR